MRPLVVVDRPEAGERVLLRGNGGLGRLGGLRLERLVKALVAAILLGMARLDEPGLDAQPQQPHAQPRQPAKAARSERWPRVTQHEPRQAELEERRFQLLAHVVELGGDQRATHQGHSAEDVVDGERIQPL